MEENEITHSRVKHEPPSCQHFGRSLRTPIQKVRLPSHIHAQSHAHTHAVLTVLHRVEICIQAHSDKHFIVRLKETAVEEHSPLLPT